MVNIKFGRYAIKTIDDNNIAIVETKKVLDPKSKRCGEEYDVIKGYYATIGGALNGIVRLRINGPDTDLRSLEDVQIELKKLEERICYIYDRAVKEAPEEA